MLADAADSPRPAELTGHDSSSRAEPLHILKLDNTRSCLHTETTMTRSTSSTLQAAGLMLVTLIVILPL